MAPFLLFDVIITNRFSKSVTIQHKVHFAYMLVIIYISKRPLIVPFIVVNKSVTILNWSSIVDKRDRIEKSAPVRDSGLL